MYSVPVQILSVDEMGEGIKPIRPQSLVDMMKVGLVYSFCSLIQTVRMELS